MGCQRANQAFWIYRLISDLKRAAPSATVIVDTYVQIITNNLTKCKSYHFKRTTTEKNLPPDHRASQAGLL